jgi:hypothetical protein
MGAEPLALPYLLSPHVLRRQIGDQGLDRQAQAGVYPVRRDVAQREQNESAQVGAWVWQDEIGYCLDQASHIDDIEVECAGGVWKGSNTAGVAFDALQGSK